MNKLNLKPLTNGKKNNNKKTAMVSISKENYNLVKTYGGGYFNRGINYILEEIQPILMKNLEKEQA